MRKLPFILCSIVLILIAFSTQVRVQAGSVRAPLASSVSEVLDAVNALRTTYRAPSYQSNAILMGTAQAHADYMASIGVSTVHTDAQGLLPYQRAINAGYAVAGDLSQGGWFSENVAGGIGMTASEVVDLWMGDQPHLLTMVSSNLVDAGVGVAVVGDTYYYCLDAGLPKGGSQVANSFYAPNATSVPNTTLAPVFATNTPNADGSITHIVLLGEYPGGIAIAYGISLSELYRLNGMTTKSVIYPGNKLTIRVAFTPTPTQPTGTPTQRPTITAWPTFTQTNTATPIPATPTPIPGLPASSARNTVSLIVGVALIIAALIALLGRKRK